MIGKRTFVALSSTITILLVAWLISQRSEPTNEVEAALESLAVVDADLSAYAQALEPDSIEFPRDLGTHNAYQTEWWYYTGIVATEEGRQFGFQLTFFRRALTPEEVVRESEWGSNQLYFAHFAVSDIETGRFYANERFSRGAAGLAGAEADPYAVWLTDWSLSSEPNGDIRLQASVESVTLDLSLTQTMPPILHGEGGLSTKGPAVGNASYYYSIIRQAAVGQVRIEGQAFDVSGSVWKDHEYSTSTLEEDVVGWDWFALSLDDGSALMFFEMRRADGTISRFSHGSLIAPDGSVTSLEADEWTMTVTDTWRSPHNGTDYPAGWQITIPAYDIALSGVPLMADQELNLSTIYWEGAVSFSGEKDGRPVTALGYIELTGYAQSMRGRL